MTPQELKNSILQLAIQGRLVEQRPEEGTAEELYKKIQAEKQSLIKAGKLKKEKPLPPITDDEKPFEIPESWMWVRIGSAFSSIMGQSPEGNSVFESGDGMEFHQGKIFFSKMVINHSSQVTTTPTKIAPAGSLLLCVRAPVGKVNITDRELCIGRGLSAIISHANVSILFVFYWMQPFENVFIKKSTGTTFKAISADVINNQVIPLPPLAEQKRIVAKIEELLPLIDRYEKAWTRLEDFNKRFPDDMQKSILQMAIQGKLVEQRPEEGTAEDLYKQIQSEKQSLIKAGKIKKEKPLPPISDDEIPFEIPENWKWVRFSELMLTMSTGPFGSMLHKADYVENGIPLVNPANIVNGKIIPSDKMMVSEDTRTRLSSYILHCGMIVMGRRGEMGRCAVVTFQEDGWLCGTGSFFMEPSTYLYIDYIHKLFSTSYVKHYLGEESVGTTMSNLNHTILSKMPVPLPPLAEQKRIVAKIEELLPLCERLK